MEATIVYWGYIGIMEETMETTIVYCGYMISDFGYSIVIWELDCQRSPVLKFPSARIGCYRQSW